MRYQSFGISYKLLLIADKDLLATFFVNHVLSVSFLLIFVTQDIQ